MRKMFILNNSSEQKIKKKEYLSPSYSFVPITSKLTKKININDIILKGEYLSKDNYSSVSGIVKGVIDCNTYDKKVKSIILQNNYKEQRFKNKKISNIDKLNEMLDTNILNKLNEKKENLILSCFSEEPYTYNIKYYIADNYRELLDTLDFLKKNYNFKNIYIIVKDTERNNIEKFIKIIGNYPEIKFITIPNIYPVNNTDYYEKHLNISDACVLNFKELYKVYYLLHHQNCYNEIYLTINLDDKISIVVKVKLGTSVKELLDYLKINYKDYQIYLNGFIGGKKINSVDNLIITDDLNSICLTKKELQLPLKCLNCGNCYKYCPMGIDPRRIMKDSKNNSKSPKCLNCGLCNYICPAYINLRKIVRGDD